MGSRPLKVLQRWKYATDPIDRTRDAGEAFLDYQTDSDGGIAGVQNAFRIDGIPLSVDDTTVQVYLVQVDNEGKRPHVRFLRTGVTTVLNDASGINDSDTSFVVTKPTGSNDFKVGESFLFGASGLGEICTITNIVVGGGGTDTWTVRRGDHGSTAVAQADGQTIELFAVGSTKHPIGNKEITLVGDQTPLGAPTLTLTAIFNGFELQITPPTDIKNKLAGYAIFRGTSANPTTVYAEVAAPHEDENLVVTNLLKESDDKAIDYYFRVKTITKTGVLSTSYSNEANAKALFSGLNPTSIETSDAPTVSVAANGITSLGVFLMEVGVVLSSNKGAGSVAETEIQVADDQATHDNGDPGGFSSTVQTRTTAAPPALENVQIGEAGLYQFSARVKNAITGNWSLWSSPVSKATRYGSPDAGLPAVPSLLKVVDRFSRRGVGSSAAITVGRPATNYKTGWGYGIQVGEGDVAIDTAFDDGFESITGLKTVDYGGLGGGVGAEESGTAPEGTRVLTVNGDPGWAANQHDGKILFLYTSINADGSVGFPRAYTIESHTTGAGATVTVTAESGVFPREPGASNDTVKVAIAQDWQAASGLAGDLYWIDNHFIITRGPQAAPGSAPDELQSRAELTVSEDVWIRVRANNAMGFGPWRYHDGSTGTATKSSATKFTPGDIILSGVGPAIKTDASPNPRVEVDETGLRTYDALNNLLVDIPTTGGNEAQIILTESDTVPGGMRFGSYAHVQALGGSTVNFSPLTDGAGILGLGATAKRWGTVNIEADDIFIQAADSPGDILIDASTGSLALDASEQIDLYKRLRLFNIGVLHGITDIYPEGTFGVLDVLHPSTGGLYIAGLTDVNNATPLYLDGYHGHTDPIDSSPAVFIRGFKRSGTARADLAAAETVLSVANGSSSAGLTMLGSSFVGLGTVSPLVQVHISSTGELLRLDDSSSTGSPFMSFYQNGTRRSYIQHLDSGDMLRMVSEQGIAHVGGVGIQLDSSEDIYLYASSNLKATLTSTGLGLGTAAPDTWIHVDDETAGEGARVGKLFAGNWIGGGDYATLSHWDNRSSSSNYSWLNDPSGNTFLNAKTGAKIYLRVNNSNVGVLDADSVSFAPQTDGAGILALGATANRYGTVNIEADDIFIQAADSPGDILIDASTGSLALDASARIDLLKSMRITGRIHVTDEGVVPSDGEGIEVYYNPSGEVGWMLCYDRGASAYRSLSLQADTVTLFYGGSNGMQLHTDGGVTIGVPTGSTKGAGTLNVAGGVWDNNTGPLADYVFKPGYSLMTIERVERFFQANHHLPWIRGEKEVEEKGRLNVGEQCRQITETIENQMLHIAALNRRLKELERRGSKRKTQRKD